MSSDATDADDVVVSSSQDSLAKTTASSSATEPKSEGVESSEDHKAADDPASAKAAAEASATDKQEQTAAPVHTALSGDLPVTLSFTNSDGASVDSVSVCLQLQSRTASWNPADSSWGECGDWVDVSGDAAKINLSAEELIQVKDADSQYTFTDLSLQTVTDEGAYASRTQYRVIETQVDGIDLAYDSTSEDGAMTYRATVSTSKAEYAVTVPVDAALEALTDETGVDIASPANGKPEIISVVNTLQPAASIALSAQSDPNTFTVYNTAYNYGDGDKITYRVDSPCTVKDGSTTIVTLEANGSFQIDNSLASFTIVTTASSLSVTLDAATTACSIIGSNPQTLSTGGVNPTSAVTFRSQKAKNVVNVQKDWFDGATTKTLGSVEGMSVALQYSVNGTDWTTITDGNAGDLGLAAAASIPAPTGNDSAWKYTFTKSLNQYDASGAATLSGSASDSTGMIVSVADNKSASTPATDKKDLAKTGDDTTHNILYLAIALASACIAAGVGLFRHGRKRHGQSTRC